MSRRRRSTGFTLLEAIAVIVLVAVAVPPMILVIGRATGVQADAVQVSRATTLAQSVLETVLADVQSAAPGLGFDGLSDAAVYVDTPATGLRDRLAWVAEPYEQVGMRWEIEIGEPTDWSGVVDDDAGQNVFRLVEVRVSVPLMRSTVDVPVRMRVTEVNG